MTLYQLEYTLRDGLVGRSHAMTLDCAIREVREHRRLPNACQVRVVEAARAAA